MSKSTSVEGNSQTNRILSVLNKIGSTLIAFEDPKNVLLQIAEDAKEILGADIVDLYEYIQVRQKFVLPPILVGDRLDVYVPKNKIYEDDVVVKVVQAGKAQYFPDAQKTPVLTGKFNVPRSDIPENRFVVREKVRSSASLPLQVGEETVGVMFVNYRSSQEFDDAQKGLIEAFSHLAAIAINNSRLWKLQNHQLASLKEIIDVIGSGNPLPVILEQASNLFSANHSSISRLMDDGHSLQYKALWVNGKLEQNLEENAILRSVSDGITGLAVRTGSSVLASDVSQHPNYAEWYPSTKSEMAIPLRNAFGGIIGVLNLESDYINFFNKEHEKLCVSFANAASAAIQQSDLLENIQSLHALTEWHNINELLDGMLKNLNKMLGSNTASSVNLYDQENDNFYSFYGVGPDPEFVHKYLLVPPRVKGTGRYVLETGESLFYEDIQNIPENFPKIRSEAWDQGIRSFAVLPLTYQDKMLGALFIHKINEQVQFNEDARRILGTYATEAALAIHNTQRRVDIEPLKDILTATVSGSQSEILEQIAEKTVHIMDSDYASIWLHEKETGDLLREVIYVRPGEKEFVNLGSTRLYRGHASINMSVFESRKSVVIPDVMEKEREHLYNRIYQKAKSEIAVPLIFHNEVIGTLNTESQKLGAFSELDMATLRLIADVATIAIKVAQSVSELSKVNMRITEEVERKTEQLKKRNEELYHMNYRLERRNTAFEALTQIGQQLTADIQQGEKEILTIIHRQASHIMDTDNMYIALYDKGKDMVRFGLAFLEGKPVDISTIKGWEPRSGGHGRTEWIIKNKAPILSYTKIDSENWYKQPGAEEYIGQTFASWLGVPIMYGDEVMGVIAAYHRTEEYKYDPDDLKVLGLMGRQAAIALQNARLVGQLGDRIVELDKIRELGEDLSRGIL